MRITYNERQFGGRESATLWGGAVRAEKGNISGPRRWEFPYFFYNW